LLFLLSDSNKYQAFTLKYHYKLHMKHFYHLILYGLLLSLFSCETINPDEDVPATIEIAKISFDAKPLEGTDSAYIADAWVYLDGEIIGAFEMPASFPVLATGNHLLEVRPGIILNGISSTRTIYPFYKTYTQEIELVAGQPITIKPTSSYLAETIFPWNSRGEEDFEEGGISIDSVVGSTVKITKSSEEVYQGGASGKIALNENHTYFIGQSSNTFTLPKANSAVVMELNIKNQNAGLEVGMYVNLAGSTVVEVPHMTITTSEKWKKLYINFTELVSYYTEAESYRVFFRANIGTGDSTNIYLDNIKILHF